MDHLKPRSADGEHLINHLKCKKLSRTGGPEPTVIGQTQLSPKWVKQVHKVGGLALYNCLFVCLFVCLIVCLFIGIKPQNPYFASVLRSIFVFVPQRSKSGKKLGMDCAWHGLCRVFCAGIFFFKSFCLLCFEFMLSFCSVFRM